MPDPAQNVDLVDQDGRRLSVPLDQAASLLSSGSYHVETGTEQAKSATAQVREQEFGGVGGKIASTLAGGARGVTLGLSDVAARQLGYGDTLAGLREENTGLSTASEILGALTGPKFLPSGLLSQAGARVAGLGEEAGFLGKTAIQTGGAALEGAGQSAGSYISQAALDNKPLSAEGFLGSAGSGALLGGGIGGAFSLGETALVKAKTLFPRGAVTREAAQDAERVATSEVSSAVDDGKDLLRTAREELAKNRALVSASDAETAQKLNALKVQRAESALQREQVKTQQALERPAKAGRKPRKAFAGEEGAAPGTAAPGAAEGPPPSVPSPGQGASDDLLGQLQATKQGLDEGQSLGQLSKRSLDDEVDDLVAARDPGHAKLLDATRELDEAQSAMDAWLGKYNKGGKYGTGEVAAFERNQASREYAAGMRPKEAGYYSKVPEGEGNALLPRGREQVFRGSEEERALFDAKTMSKLSPEERVAADQAAAGMFKPKSVAEEILSGAASAVTAPNAPIEQTIAGALRKHVGEHVDMSDDIAEAVGVIGRVEKAQADVADALGPLAPPASQIRAEQYRAATATHTESTAANVADLAKQMEKKLPADVAVPAPKLTPAVEATKAGEGAGMLGKAADIGAVLEVMSTLGLPGIPDLKSLPVIGPVLSLYLKARAASAVYRRLGGKIPASTESTVAKRAAQTRDRVAQAVDKMLDVSATAAREARKVAGPMAALGTKLFDAPEDRDATPTKGKKAEPYRNYEQRLHELTTATQPGMIADAVKRSVPTSDPALQAELVSAAERKYQFLADKAPKKMQLPTLLKGDGDWKPSKVQLAQFSRYIEAAEDPAGVLEKLGNTGTVTYEAAETLRTVYPALYQEAQKRLLERAPELKEKLPYARRVSLSILFQVPVDGTMDANFVSFLRQGQPAASATPAQGSPAPAPPTPTASGPVMLGDRTMTRLDRRAGA